MDLNLLTALDALIEHQSVQGAAAALHVTPPAMSHTLRRLRLATGDDVLVRNGRHMTPTPRALQLRDEVRDLVVRAEGVLSPPTSLDLARLERTFTIRGNEALIAALAPPLLEEIAISAPGVVVVLLGEQTVDGEDLARGMSDLEIGNERAVAASIRTETVGAGLLEVVMRRENPLAELGEISVAEFADAAHVVISRRGRLSGPVDELLAARGLHRRVIAALPTTAMALSVVERSDAITVVAGRLIPQGAFSTAPVPLDLTPLSAMVSWHRRHDSDPAHSWLRSRVGEILTRLLEE